MMDSQSSIDALSSRAEMSGFADARYKAKRRDHERGEIKNRDDSGHSDCNIRRGFFGADSADLDSISAINARQAQIIEEHNRNRLNAAIGIKNSLVFGIGVWIFGYLLFHLVSELF